MFTVGGGNSRSDVRTGSFRAAVIATVSCRLPYQGYRAMLSARVAAVPRRHRTRPRGVLAARHGRDQRAKSSEGPVKDLQRYRIGIVGRGRLDGFEHFYLDGRRDVGFPNYDKISFSRQPDS